MFFSYFYRHNRGLFLRASLYSILNKLFDLAPPVLIGLAIDVVTRKEDSYLALLPSNEPSTQLTYIVLLTIVIWTLESFFEYLFDIHWKKLSQSTVHHLRMTTYRHLQTLEMSYFENRSTGNLATLLNDDVNQLERFLDGGINELLQVSTTVVIVGTIFFFKNPSLSFFAFIPMPFIIWGSLWFQKFIFPRYKKVREEVGILGQDLSNNFQGIGTIKSFHAEDFEAKKIEAQGLNYQAASLAAIRISALYTPLIRMLVMAGFIVSLMFGGKLVLEGKLSVGDYSVLVFLIQRLLWPLTRLGQTLDLYQRGKASFARLQEVLKVQSSIVPGKKTLKLTHGQGQIEFKQVDFSYIPNFPVLRSLSLSIPQGKTVGIVGVTGSGKSTLVKLILRFYDVNNGSIELQGEDIRTLNFDSLRNQIGHVGQDVFLFHGTIRENIAYGNPNIPLEKIIESAKLAEAHEFIQNLPNQYDTVIGERGQKLSGGQRQRISIARSIIKNPPILIFDEATSAVDNETEAAIQRSLSKLSQNRTMILIAHRLSTVVKADVIYVLKDGKVTESGTHQELISKKATYFNLWQVQTSGGEA